jgi:hypothetical protein
VLSQFLQIGIANGGGSARHLVSKVNRCFLLLIEMLAAMIKKQRLDLFLGNADPLRRSGMGARSILASVNG